MAHTSGDVWWLRRAAQCRVIPRANGRANQPNRRLRRKTCRSKATAGLLLQEQLGVSAPAFQVAPFPRPVGSCGSGNGHPLRRFLRLRRLGRSNEDGSQTRGRSEEHTSELQSQSNLVCRLLLEKK